MIPGILHSGSWITHHGPPITDHGSGARAAVSVARGLSAAATEITTRLFEERAGTTKLGRAEALRRLILALMETADKPYYAHPLFGAPFVVVGEGARP